jgi:hypothetical protein
MEYPIDHVYSYEIISTFDNIDLSPIEEQLLLFYQMQSEQSVSGTLEEEFNGFIIQFIKQFESITCNHSTTSDVIELHAIKNTEEISHILPSADYACGKCRYLLFSSDDIHNHNLTTSSAACTSVFLDEPLEWIPDSTEYEAKILCPKCSNRVGSYCWAGLQCSCMEWITPGIKFVKSKIDAKYK